MMYQGVNVEGLEAYSNSLKIYHQNYNQSNGCNAYTQKGP